MAIDETSPIAPIENLLNLPNEWIAEAIKKAGGVRVASATERDFEFPAPRAGDRVYREDKGYFDVYCGAFDLVTNKAGALSAGWWPEQAVPLPISGTQAVFTLGTNTSQWELAAVGDSSRTTALYRNGNRIHGTVFARKVNGSPASHGEVPVIFKSGHRPPSGLEAPANFNTSPSTNGTASLSATGNLTLLSPPGGTNVTITLDFPFAL